MRRLAYVFFLFFLLLNADVFGQEKYWIYFNSKTGTALNTEDEAKLERDLPIYQPFLDSLARLEVTPIIKSKWLNAVTAFLTEDQIEHLHSSSFVSNIEATRQVASAASYEDDNAESYSTALKQVNAKALVDYGFTGEGVDIGIIDVGFMEANESVLLEDIFYEDQFKEFKDFTGENTEPFGGQKIYREDHGTRVWRNIGGYDREKEQYHGLATYANYYLAKSDRGDVEFRGEEDYWVAAMEWMDSKGIKIVNSSVGYSTGFDNPTENHKPAEIDGRSSPITQAAQIAAKEKGILVVVSAGNDGNKDFKVLSVPSDAKDVLTVGSCSSTSGKKISHSSIGPETLEYVKPDVCCYSLGGTSFSAPIITGIAAGMLQHDPSLTNMDIIDIIKKSSHLYPYANNYIGYGAPDGEKILQLMADRSAQVWDAVEMEVVGDLASFQSEGVPKVAVFHKKNDFLVIREDELEEDSGEFIVARPAGTVKSTIALKGKVYEITWK